MNSYELSRKWFDFSFENPQKIKPYHSAIYFFAIEHCNRLGWKKVFGFPTSIVLDAIGMKSYNSYKKYFDELVDFGFIKIHEYSKNQYSSNIIELTLNDKALDKALDKAFIKHSTKQSESTKQSIDSIDKQLYKETNKHPSEGVLKDIRDLRENYLNNIRVVNAVCENPKNNISKDQISNRLIQFNNHLTEINQLLKTENDYSSHFLWWHKKNKTANTPKQPQYL